MFTWNLRMWPNREEYLQRELRILRLNHPGLRVGPKSSDWCPCKKRRGPKDKQRKGHVEMESETGLSIYKPRGVEDHGSHQRTGERNGVASPTGKGC